MRHWVLIRGVVVLLISILTLYITNKLMNSPQNINNIKWMLGMGSGFKKNDERQPCDIECPEHNYPFRIISGAASVVGPSICFNGNILMSNIKNNIGRGLNIALVNATTGKTMQTDFFDMWSGDINLLLAFLKPIVSGTIVLLASFDDPATKMNDKARTIFSELGSSLIHSVKFRDNWVFVGAKGIKEKSPYEQIIQNDKAKNKYGAWPEAVEMEGCIPKKHN
uniref:FAM3 metabolism regulating signaling molecule D n=1 Tax=Callorhinchus milii TaxID=7868 RepID=A0A4W3GX51_CALMI